MAIAMILSGYVNFSVAGVGGSRFALCGCGPSKKIEDSPLNQQMNRTSVCSSSTDSLVIVSLSKSQGHVSVNDQSLHEDITSPASCQLTAADALSTVEDSIGENYHAERCNAESVSSHSLDALQKALMIQGISRVLSTKGNPQNGLSLWAALSNGSNVNSEDWKYKYYSVSAEKMLLEEQKNRSEKLILLYLDTNHQYVALIFHEFGSREDTRQGHFLPAHDVASYISEKGFMFTLILVYSGSVIEGVRPEVTFEGSWYVAEHPPLF